MLLAGKVCVVTGASRGIGKGIALQLGEQGAKVYITGRTLDPPKGSKVSGSLRDTAREIEARGGNCIPVQCDHGNDDEVERLFEQIKIENDGQLDILVNNAYAAADAILSNLGKKFWELPFGMWDQVTTVGLRNHYVCSVYAARLMVPRKRGLIVNISSHGGIGYLFNVPYGVGKEACDRMAADCAFELRQSNIAFVSLWPGAVYTEVIESYLNPLKAKTATEASLSGSVDPTPLEQTSGLFETTESSEFSGMCIVKLATDPGMMQKSGRTFPVSDLAREYGISDKPGQTPWDFRQLKFQLQMSGYHKTAMFVPGFLRVPRWLLHLQANRL